MKSNFGGILFRALLTAFGIVVLTQNVYGVSLEKVNLGFNANLIINWYLKDVTITVIRYKVFISFKPFLH